MNGGGIQCKTDADKRVSEKSEAAGRKGSNENATLSLGSYTIPCFRQSTRLEVGKHSIATKALGRTENARNPMKPVYELGRPH